MELDEEENPDPLVSRIGIRRPRMQANGVDQDAVNDRYLPTELIAWMIVGLAGTSNAVSSKG